MTILQRIFAYWQANTTLCSAIPFERVWGGNAPAKTQRPYAVILPLGGTPTPLTAPTYWETASIQISIYSDSWDEADALASTVDGQFFFKTVGGDANISCERTNVPFVMVDPDTPTPTYHAVLTYDLRVNSSLPS